ncbi:MAG TPA: FecR family protein [Aestuariivirgaceae bacterium]|nr:FecR family protein [Aestuariivirgaceae bacterium]
MTQRRHSISRRLLLQGLFGIPAAGLVGPAIAAEKQVGIVSETQGEVEAESNARRRPLAKRSAVFLGDLLRTGSQARLRALLGRGTKLRLGAKTRVRIDEYIVNAGGELVLESGALLLDAPHGSFSQGLRINSPFALIAVRGTRVFAGRIDGTFGVFVVRGVVDVMGRGKKVRLRSGEGIDISRRGNLSGEVGRWGEPKIARAMALVR